MYTASTAPVTATPNTLVIYHRADWDGKISGMICQFFLEQGGKYTDSRDIVLRGWDYGDPEPGHRYDLSAFAEIFIVDLSIPSIMEDPAQRDKVVWIDHHKTAIEAYGTDRFQGVVMDGVAACRLCWQYFTHTGSFPSKSEFINRTLPEPVVVRMAGEYDVWDHRDPAGRALQKGLDLEPGMAKAFLRNEFLGNTQYEWESELASVLDRGRVIVEYLDKVNFEYVSKNASLLQFGQLLFLAVNGQGLNSLAFASAAGNHDACLVWRACGPKVTVSLYHRTGHEQHDLSRIAKAWGGGGHKGACGFTASITDWADILETGTV